VTGRVVCDRWAVHGCRTTRKTGISCGCSNSTVCVVVVMEQG
jgi:hypothetical protein